LNSEQPIQQRSGSSISFQAFSRAGAFSILGNEPKKSKQEVEESGVINSKIFKEQLDHFEKRRLRAVRIFVHVLNVINTLFSVNAFLQFGSLNNMERVMQSLYLICVVVISNFLYRSYTVNLKQIYPALLVLSYRNALPILNLENQDVFYSRGNGYLLLASQIVATTYCITMLTNLFLPFKLVYQVSLTMLVLGGLVKNFYSLDELSEPANYVFLTVFSLMIASF